MIAEPPVRATPARRRTEAAATKARPGRGRSRATSAVRPGVAVASGLLWAALLVAAVVVGPVAVAAVVTPVSVVAAIAGVRGLRRRGSPPGAVSAVSAGVALCVPVAGLGGLAAGVGVAIGAAFVTAGVSFSRVPGRLRFRVMFAILAPSTAAMALVVARDQGFGVGLALVIAGCLYDMASFVMGTRPTGGIAGVVAGVFSVAALAVFVSAVADPPFSGHSPWVLFGAVAALAPAGVWLCNRLAAGRPPPALCRLDAFVLAGPAWVIAVAVMLHR